MIHSIVAKWAFDKAGKRQPATLRCPQCRFEQPAAQKTKAAISCKKCGGEISPLQTIKQREVKGKIKE